VGAGADTTFVVDNMVDLQVQEIGAAATSVSSGQVNAVTAFRVINEGNNTQGFNLSAANVGGTLYTRADAFDMGNLRTFVSAAACTLAATSAPAYNAGTDTAVNIPSLAADSCRWVYIVADTPLASNDTASNVQLTAVARVETTLAALTETAGAESASVVDVVFADPGRDVTETALDQYHVQTAALSVAKSSVVISDPFNLTTNPKAIPNATVEYGITLTNTGTADATVVTISDSIPANTTLANNTYAGGTNVRITVGSTDTFCIADAVNTDGCVLAGGVLTVGAPAVTSVQQGAANAVTVRFRVTIN
jgi:uncharacterized repeat protein (TIGR01451 family)